MSLIQFFINGFEKTIAVGFFSLCITFFGCAPPTEGLSEETTAVHTPQQTISSLAEKIDKSEIENAEILYIPHYIVHSVNITPERLKNSYKYKIIIRDFDHSVSAERLSDALKHTNVESTKSSSDLRWSLKISFHRGSAVEIDMDGFGRYGQIDSVPVTFNGRLYTWLKEITASLS